MRRTVIIGAVLVLAGCSASVSGGGGVSSSPGGSGGSSSTPSSAPRSTHTSTVTASASASGTASGTAALPTNAVAGRAAPRLTDFRAVDLTWIGDEGWALGGADCLSGHGTCDAIEHTTDGGASWSSLPAPRAGIADGSCRSTCVSGVRFANRKIGYSFGRDSFFMTLDGGRSWRREPGNAVALEALDDNVLRVTTSAGCPPGCTFHVQAALYGNPTWKTLSLGRTLQGVAATLGRADHRVYLETFLNPAGGAQHAYASLFTSGDDGAHWTARGEPCPQIGGENDSRELSVAPTGAAAIVCEIRGATERSTLITSATGTRWHRPSGDGLGSGGVYSLGAATQQRAVLSGGDATYLTTDEGARFTRTGASAQLRWLAFGSTKVGHAISRDGSVWSTGDGGATWRHHTFR